MKESGLSRFQYLLCIGKFHRKPKKICFNCLGDVKDKSIYMQLTLLTRVLHAFWLKGGGGGGILKSRRGIPIFLQIT